MEILLIVIFLLVLGGFYFTLKYLRRLFMTTAQLLALLQDSDAATDEIASDLDALIALIGAQGNVDPEIAAAAEALLAKLVVNKDKYTPE